MAIALGRLLVARRRAPGGSASGPPASCSADRTSPTTDGWPPSISARIAGHSLQHGVDARAARGRASRRCPVGGSARNAWRSRKWSGTRNQSSDWTWRRTRASKRGDPLAGGVVSGGAGTGLEQVAGRQRHPAAQPGRRVAEAQEPRVERPEPHGGARRERVREAEPVDGSAGTPGRRGGHGVRTPVAIRVVAQPGRRATGGRQLLGQHRAPARGRSSSRSSRSSCSSARACPAPGRPPP